LGAESARIHEQVHIDQMEPYIGIPFGHLIPNIKGKYDLDELEAYKKTRTIYSRYLQKFVRFNRNERT